MMDGLASNVSSVKKLLSEVVTHHNKIVLWGSGGKDSTVLLHLAQEYAPKIQVLSVIMDNGFPGVQECVQENCAAWGFDKLEILQPPISFPQYLTSFGWPSQLIPTSMDGTLPDPFYDGGPRLASWWHCSVVRVVLPLMQASQAHQADAVLTASRRSDAPAHARIGSVIEAHDVGVAGWTRYDLLHTWTTAQIWAYIEQHQIALPPLYAWKRDMLSEAPDCIDCPFSPEYMAWAKVHTPEVFQRIWTGFKPALDRMQTLATDHLAKWEGIADG